MITKSSVTKAFDGNARYEHMLPEFKVDVDVQFDDAMDAQKFVEEVENLLSSFPRRTSQTKTKKVA